MPYILHYPGTNPLDHDPSKGYHNEFHISGQTCVAPDAAFDTLSAGDLTLTNGVTVSELTGDPDINLNVDASGSVNIIKDSVTKLSVNADGDVLVTPSANENFQVTTSGTGTSLIGGNKFETQTNEVFVYGNQSVKLESDDLIDANSGGVLTMESNDEFTVTSGSKIEIKASGDVNIITTSGNTNLTGKVNMSQETQTLKVDGSDEITFTNSPKSGAVTLYVACQGDGTAEADSKSVFHLARRSPSVNGVVSTTVEAAGAGGEKLVCTWPSGQPITIKTDSDVTGSYTNSGTDVLMNIVYI